MAAVATFNRLELCWVLRFYTGSSEVFVLVLLDAVATNQPHCGASNGDHCVQLPTDDFVKHFGVCQQG